MNNSKVYQIAEHVFGMNYVKLAIGGSQRNDLDCVVILDKIFPKQIKEFIDKAEEATKQRVSVRAYSNMMWECGMVDSKTAVMLEKGLDLNFENLDLEFF